MSSSYGRVHTPQSKCLIECFSIDCCGIRQKYRRNMLTEYIGNLNPVEPGQVLVIAGKTIDAASRFVQK